MIRLSLLFCLLTAFPAAAEELLNAQEFDRYTRGKTLYYGQGGAIYGAEIYHENRRVTWSFLDGECKEGRWYADGPLICFTYDEDPEPHCWHFLRDAKGLIARFEGDTALIDLTETAPKDRELICLGPKVGV